ncbi:MAG TPA: hydroxymethylglutaryl-CoA lyase [Bacteroidota bacterium]|nr:hydroxymethylglutaryl-CoA lyase [Bacteroidota bacterium]
MKNIIIHEVGMRDGLQMEKQVVPMELKLKWIRAIMESGVDIIQIGSFVHPEKVPQMADTDKLFTELTKDNSRPENVVLSGLVLNEKGLERGFNCGVEMFCMGVSASETHSRKNTGMSVAEATDRIIAMAKQAEAVGKRVQVSVQSAFGCGYEGYIPQERVLRIVQKYLDAGLKKISLADTAGHATPDQVEKLFKAILDTNSSVECACHFHNTYGMGIANAYAAMKVGVQNYESSIAGLGGCPFTKIAGANLCTEDFVHMLHRMNLRRDVNLLKLIEAAKDVARFFAREMSGSVHKTGPIPERETVH